MNAVITTHKLDFEMTTWECSPSILLYRVGTCEGQYFFNKDGIYILSFLNRTPRNGHLIDVFEWFEYSAKTENQNLFILEVMNESFYKHLVEKRGFVAVDNRKENLVKIYNKKAYRKLLVTGNEVFEKGTMKCK